MAYTGVSITIPMGKGGLYTDDAPTAIPPTSLIDANNVRIFRNAVEKDAGSTPFTMTGTPVTAGALTGGAICGAIEFSYDTDPANRVIIMVGADGYVYTMPNIGGTVTKITKQNDGATNAVRLWANGTVASHNQVCLVIAGKESAAATRKVFIFTGKDQVQVVENPSGQYTMTPIANPAADWAASYPTGGFAAGGRMVAFGNPNYPHQLYSSLTTDHTDFLNTGIVLTNCDPGVGEKIVHGAVFKGLAIILKYPFGVVAVDFTTNPSAWSAQTIDTQVGGAGLHCGVKSLDDYLFKNSTGSISSLVATSAFGDFTAGDVLTNLRIEEYVRGLTNLAGNAQCHALNYGEKKQLYFSYTSGTATSSTNQDCMLNFYMGAQQDTRAKAAGYYSGNTESLLASFLTKDTQLNCLFKYRDANGIERPAYGGRDGKVYMMDQTSIDVAGGPFVGSFQTPHWDFGFAAQKDPTVALKNKNFDFLTLTYESQGDYPLFVDTLVDGVYYDTYRVEMDSEDTLADDTYDQHDFMLDDSDDGDSSLLADDFMNTIRFPIAGTGRTLSVKIYNTIADQGFKISAITVGFLLGGESQTKG